MENAWFSPQVGHAGRMVAKPKFILCLALVLSGDWFGINSSAAIIYPKEPDGGRQMVIQFASRFVGKNLPPLKKISTTNDLTFVPPLPEYGSGDLTKGQLLAGATLSYHGWQGWKYIFVHGTNVVGDAFLEADEKTGKPLECIGLGDDLFSEETLKALQVAGQLPQVQQQDYEARLLDNQLVSFHAVWLHGKSNDFIIPLPPTYDRMNAYQLYSEGQIIKILAPEARRESAMWDKLEKQRQKDNDAYAKAMTDYEKAHGGKCGSISLYGMSAPYQMIEPNVEFITLQGMSSECGKVSYKVKITYTGHFDGVKEVKILEKLIP